MRAGRSAQPHLRPAAQNDDRRGELRRRQRPDDRPGRRRHRRDELRLGLGGGQRGGPGRLRRVRARLPAPRLGPQASRRADPLRRAAGGREPAGAVHAQRRLGRGRRVARTGRAGPLPAGVQHVRLAGPRRLRGGAPRVLRGLLPAGRDRPDSPRLREQPQSADGGRDAAVHSAADPGQAGHRVRLRARMDRGLRRAELPGHAGRAARRVRTRLRLPGRGRASAGPDPGAGLVARRADSGPDLRRAHPRHRRRRRGPHPGRRPAGDPVVPVGAEPGRDRAESGAESVLAPHPRRRRDGGRVAGRAAPQRPDRDARTVRRLHPRPRGLRGHPLAGHSPHAREARPPAPPPEPVDFAAEAHRPPSPSTWDVPQGEPQW